MFNNSLAQWLSPEICMVITNSKPFGTFYEYTTQSYTIYNILKAFRYYRHFYYKYNWITIPK